MMGRNRGFKDSAIASENNDQSGEHKEERYNNQNKHDYKAYRNKISSLGYLQYQPNDIYF